MNKSPLKTSGTVAIGVVRESCTFQVTRTLGASRGYLCDSTAFLYWTVSALSDSLSFCALKSMFYYLSSFILLCSSLYFICIRLWVFCLRPPGVIAYRTTMITTWAWWCVMLIRSRNVSSSLIRVRLYPYLLHCSYWVDTRESRYNDIVGSYRGSRRRR